MFDNIDVSFFMPMYRPNRKWLDEAVDSFVRLFERNHVKCELLLGDDGSPEDAGVQSYADRYPQWIRAWRFPVNRGIGATSTALAMEASGRYIASFDQDDIIIPFDLDGEVEFLDSHQEYCASYSQKFLFNEHGFIGEVHGDILSDFQAFFTPKININAMLIRREVLASHEYFKPVPYSPINQDIWLMMRLLEDGKIYYSRSPRALYRVHTNQISNDDRQQDFSIMAQDIATRHGKLYRELLLNPELPVAETPEDKAILPKLAGLVFFCNQKNTPLVEKILRNCVTAYPDDYGIWEVILRILAYSSSREDFFSRYALAEERFRNNPDVMSIFTEWALVVNNKAGIQDRNLLELNRELTLRRCTPTALAKEALDHVELEKQTPSASYTFVNKVLTI